MTDAAPGPGARIGVIGGSGLYELLDAATATEVDVPTPYGAPSGRIVVGDFAGTRVAFLARHGAGHSLPPHRVNHRANMWALASLGVTAVFASSAVGGLSDAAATGSFLVADQLLDRTRGRDDTFFDDEVQHLPFAEPYCPGLRAVLIDALAGLGDAFSPTATVAVIPGPRFSTRAESAQLAAAGADAVNMTQYPEAALAAELGIGYACLCFVTDADVGRPATGDEAVTAEIVFARLDAARPRIVAVLARAIAGLPADYAPRVLVSRDAVARILAQEPA
jgi:5'-methylthioadenosine phosphorylase